jgi:hypothetical protein
MQYALYNFKVYRDSWCLLKKQLTIMTLIAILRKRVSMIINSKSMNLKYHYKLLNIYIVKFVNPMAEGSKEVAVAFGQLQLL